jgi:hypothetical protein
MTSRARRESRSQRHGNIFSPHSGSMYVHVQRESGLAHHTLVLKPWQVQALRALMSRWFLLVVGIGIASWMYFAAQAARVPLLTWRIAHLEQDARRIDSLQKTLTQLQANYEQVQRLMSAPSLGRGTRPDIATERNHP